MAGVVDADTHIIEHAGVWELFDPALYDRRPTLGGEGGRRQCWMIDGVPTPKRKGKGSVSVAVGGSETENSRTDIPAEVRYITDPKARVAALDARDVEIEVVYPTLLLAYITPDVALERAMYGAYNKFLAQAWRKAGDRMRWVVAPPLRDIAASVREIEMGRDNGAVGVFFRGVEDQRSLAEDYFKPIYETANRLNMAICVHTGAGSPVISSVFDRDFSHNLPHVRSLPLFAFRDLVAHKIPERYPNIRFGFIEASASWVPYVLHHLQRASTVVGSAADADPTLAWGPKLFRDYRLFVAVETDEDLGYLARYIGEDNMVVGSDYGHLDQSKETGMVALLRARKDLTPAVIEKILSANPRRLYGL